jgi:hypothetical protein
MMKWNVPCIACRSPNSQPPPTPSLCLTRSLSSSSLASRSPLHTMYTMCVCVGFYLRISVASRSILVVSMLIFLTECIPRLRDWSRSSLHPWLDTIFSISILASATLREKIHHHQQHLNGSYLTALTHGRSSRSKASLPCHGADTQRHTLACIPKPHCEEHWSFP